MIPALPMSGFTHTGFSTGTELINTWCPELNWSTLDVLNSTDRRSLRSVSLCATRQLSLSDHRVASLESVSVLVDRKLNHNLSYIRQRTHGHQNGGPLNSADEYIDIRRINIHNYNHWFINLLTYKLTYLITSSITGSNLTQLYGIPSIQPAILES